MNNKTNNGLYDEITINDIKAIKDYENISDDQAIEIMNSIKQIALILYNQKKPFGNSKSTIVEDKILELKIVHKQAA